MFDGDGGETLELQAYQIAQNAETGCHWQLVCRMRVAAPQGPGGCASNEKTAGNVAGREGVDQVHGDEGFEK